jgi:hypothetical protein
MFSFASPSSPDVQGMRLLGGGELNLTLMKDLVKVRLFYILLPTLASARCHDMT